MSIAFRYFPYLVQQNVMHQMDLIDVFSLYTISEKSKTLVKIYFKRQECQFSYDMRSIDIDMPRVRIKRNISSRNYCYERDQVAIKPMMMNDREHVLCFGTSLKTDKLQIPVKSSDDLYEGVLRFAQDLFREIKFRFDFGTSNLEDFLKTMNFAKEMKVTVEKVEIGNYCSPNDSLMTAVLTECLDVKILIIRGLSSRFFQYDYLKNPPFKFDFFHLNGARWVTKDHLINLFFGCKKVILISPEVNYSDQELFEICQKWLEASETEYLKIFRPNTLPESIRTLSGAVPVKELRLEEDYLKFGPNKCYKVKKTDRKPAIIYSGESHIVLTIEFKDAVIGEGVDVPKDLPGQWEFDWGL